MGDGRGYKIPENAQPEGFRCLAVLIPDDDQYLYAFGGAYEYFTKWNAWEKDEQRRGRLAAEAWRNAYNATMNDYWTEGMIMSCTEVQLLIDTISDLTNRLEASQNRVADAIRALELTTTPIDCIPCGERVDVPPTPIVDPDPQNPPVGNNPTEWETYLCRATNYLWYEHVLRGGAEMILLASLGGSLLGVGSVIAILYASGVGAPIAFAGSIIAAIVAVAAIHDETSFEVELERLAQPMICAIANASGTETALQAMRDTLVDEGAEQALIDYVMSVTGTNAINKLFNGEIVVPDEFIQPHDCSCIPEPEWPNLIFRPVTNWVQYAPAQNYQQLEFNGNEITLQSTVGGNVVVYLDLQWSAQAGEQFVGYYFEVISTQQNKYVIADLGGVAPLHVFDLEAGEKIGARNISISQDAQDFYATLINAGHSPDNLMRIVEDGASNGDTLVMRAWYVYETI